MEGSSTTVDKVHQSKSGVYISGKALDLCSDSRM